MYLHVFEIPNLFLLSSFELFTDWTWTADAEGRKRPLCQLCQIGSTLFDWIITKVLNHCCGVGLVVRLNNKHVSVQLFVQFPLPKEQKLFI